MSRYGKKMSSKEKVELCEAVYFMRDIKTIGDLWESAFLLQWTEIRPIIRSDAGTDATYDSKVFSFFFFEKKQILTSQMKASSKP